MIDANGLSIFNRLSNKWKSNVWSGKLKNCELAIEWTRVCNQTGYDSCIAKIVDHYELTFDPQPDKLNGISDEDRELYDTFEDEFDCLDQFCPWTPTGKFCLSFTKKKETWSVTKSHHFFVFVFSTNKNFWTNSTVFLLHQIRIVKYWTVDCKYVFTFSTRFFSFDYLMEYLAE